MFKIERIIFLIKDVVIKTTTENVCLVLIKDFLLREYEFHSYCVDRLNTEVISIKDHSASLRKLILSVMDFSKVFNIKKDRLLGHPLHILRSFALCKI